MGPTGYSTVKAAFDAINAGIHQGVITITIACDINEPLSAVLKGSGAGPAPSPSYTRVTMSPAGGPWTVSGAIMPGRPLIDLDGADNVTIDGLSPNEGSLLTLSNTTASATASTSTIRFINDAADNRVTRCKIRGSSITPLNTAGGTILFSTGATIGTGTGNDGNTISWCDIGPADPLLLPPSKAIMGFGSTTNAGIANSGITINDNNIFDFFLPGGNTSGINIITGNHNWLIANNRIYQTATRTFTATASRYSGITINQSNSFPLGRFLVTSNTIGFGAANGGGTTIITGLGNEIRGIDAGSVDTILPTSIQGNTISGINQTTNRNSTLPTMSAFIGISVGATGGFFNVGDTVGNTIGSLDGSSGIIVNSTSVTANTASITGIADFSLHDDNVSNNRIGTITISGGTGGTGRTAGFRGILVLGPTGRNMTINDNVIGGLAADSITDNIRGNYTIAGIESRSANVSANRNIVRNMRGNSTIPYNRTQPSPPPFSGIVCSGSNGSNTISQNTIHSLSNSGGAQTAVVGISLRFLATANVVERNFVHSLSMAAPNPTFRFLVGINALSGNATYQNNMVRLGIDAGGNSITLGLAVYGIYEIGGLNHFYHNSVYIGGSGVRSSHNTACFFSRVTTGPREYKNNIFENNRRNFNGPGVNIAFRPFGNLLPPESLLISDGNVYYAPNPNGVVIRHGPSFPASTDYTLLAWRAVSGNVQDVNSFGLSDPRFIRPDGIATTGTSTTVDLHLMDPPTVTVCEGHGVPGTGVTDDFDGSLRSAFGPIDIGADAGAFVPCSPPHGAGCQ